jgi:hypothetical protein
MRREMEEREARVGELIRGEKQASNEKRRVKD